MGLCESCKNNSCGYAREDVIGCGNFEENLVQTNADRIRAMSDEELARCLLTVDDAGKYCKNLPECEKLLDTPEGIPEEKCLGCLVEWLREPAEE